MELEKTLTVAAPLQRVWDLLLDPKIMAGCVPGTQSVEVVSDTEYLAEIKVKISFIAARFKVRTRIIESRPPTYLRMEGTGEDSSVASTMKQTSELCLTDLGDGRTEIRVKAEAHIMGRLGSFGLSVMKTKADRMWEEFGANFAAIATRNGDADVRPADVQSVDAPARAQALNGTMPSAAATATPSAAPRKAAWWQRIMKPGAGAASVLAEGPAAGTQRLPTDIYVELHRPGGVIKVLWPSSAAPEAVRWLKDLA